MLRKIVYARRLALVSILLVAASGSAAARSPPFTRPYRILGRRGSDLAVRRIEGAASLQGDTTRSAMAKAASAEPRVARATATATISTATWSARMAPSPERGAKPVAEIQRKHRGQESGGLICGRHRRAGILGRPVALDARQQASLSRYRPKPRHPETSPSI